MQCADLNRSDQRHLWLWSVCRPRPTICTQKARKSELFLFAFSKWSLIGPYWYLPPQPVQTAVFSSSVLSSRTFAMALRFSGRCMFLFAPPKQKQPGLIPTVAARSYIYLTLQILVSEAAQVILLIPHDLKRDACLFKLAQQCFKKLP